MSPAVQIRSPNPKRHAPGEQFSAISYGQSYLASQARFGQKDLGRDIWAEGFEPRDQDNAIWVER